MTERQDLRPLSTEDLLPDHDRTHADDRDRDAATDEYGTPTTGEHYDTDRPVVSDQYDEVDADKRPYGETTDQYDEQPTTLDDDQAVRDETVHDDTVVEDEPVAETVDEPVVAQQKPAANDDEAGAAPLFTGEEVDRFRGEWRGLQSDFVDSPRDAVQHADQLVAQVMQSLATTFADHKKSLEGQWSKGEQVETEELRVALRQYRAFFDKLLTV